MFFVKSEGDDVDLAEEFVNSDLDWDWEGEDGDVQNSEENNSESDLRISCLQRAWKHVGNEIHRS